MVSQFLKSFCNQQSSVFCEANMPVFVATWGCAGHCFLPRSYLGRGRKNQKTHSADLIQISIATGAIFSDFFVPLQGIGGGQHNAPRHEVSNDAEIK